ncbi:MAG: histidine kinase [Ramlibacter sp.]|nr:histidine kinase [Ramlibacter sp.]
MKIFSDRRLPWGASVVAVLLAVLALLYVQAQSFDEQDYLNDVTALRHIKQLDTQVELEVLKARIASTARHDALVNAMEELRRLVDEVDADRSTEHYEQADQLHGGRTMLKQYVRDKATLVDSFMASNVALHHSVALISPTGEDLLAQIGPAATQRARAARASVRKLMADTLLLSQGTGGDPAAIPAELARLERETPAFTTAAREKTEVFGSHVRTIFSEQDVVTRLLTDILDVRLADQTEALYQILNLEEHRADILTQRLHGYLLLLSTALTALLLYAAIHVLRSHRLIARINRELQQANEHLEQRVRQRTEELHNAQDQLVTTARQAGMAEIATNVLHNVGNILNSVNVSAALIDSEVRNSRGRGLGRAVQLMKDHAHDLAGYLERDEKGRMLPAYLDGVAQGLEQERESLSAELANLIRSIEHIKAVVATQQSYTGGSGTRVPQQMRELVEEALRINDDAQPDPRLDIVKELADVPPALLDRDRVLQILINLISNAKHAMAGMASQRLTLRLAASVGRLRVCVEDEGEGISTENLTRVFTHGFTTRQAGHGFGLHSCALAAGQMGGTLSAHSEGPGRGATFTLELPLEGAPA